MNTSWHKWRQEGIGASDAPIILGISPYKTAYQLYLEKTSNEIKLDESNYVTEKGQQLEAIAREKYEKKFNVKAPPKLVEHKDYPFCRASLDGFYGDTVVEFKYVGKDVFEAGEVVKHHYSQLQHQLFVSGADHVDYVLYNDVLDEIKVIKVWPNFNFILDLFKLETLFWEHVTNKRPPPLSDKDFFIVNNDSLKSIIMDWKNVNKKIEDLSLIEKELREKITSQLIHPKNKILDVEVCKIERQGSVDYNKIPELKGVNLEQYRKKPTSYYKFNICNRGKIKEDV